VVTPSMATRKGATTSMATPFMATRGVTTSMTNLLWQLKEGQPHLKPKK
jgi:hypothetical protein